jgi:hypothetical protein
MRVSVANRGKRDADGTIWHGLAGLGMIWQDLAGFP